MLIVSGPAYDIAETPRDARNPVEGGAQPRIPQHPTLNQLPPRLYSCVPRSVVHMSLDAVKLPVVLHILRALSPEMVTRYALAE